MKLKVCGMKYQENIEHVAALQPDYLGFIFHEKSIRHFGENHMPQIPHTIKKTGVFVDAELQDVIDKINFYHLHAAQLHGHESPEYCEKLKTYNIEIIKAFSMDANFNFDDLKPYETVCDYFLFDTKGKLPGGNGYTFDWTILNKYPSKKPFFLSGGIGLNEVENLLSFLEKPESKYCYAIDVNSKFEIEAGLKDIEKLKEFKHNVITRNPDSYRETK
ncbi:phosphoribosylanthranilate isomerase [Confluentibacter citreus]|uniref:phosphoribosylanthranilate isomerase n=1 Tax=Confluentibacter citreus TaxID=2007307 RepID=UPI000C282D2A|nr:phosphoribosylanthranilate isomerase [Confluentibacter citreus]